MYTLILYIILWCWDHRSIDSITKSNETKILAEQAYRQGKFDEAIRLYEQITYESIFSETASRLNLAHAYFQNKDFKNAFKQYSLLSKVKSESISSIANAQIALIQVSQKDTFQALHSLKSALKIEPANEGARANFIILKNSFSGIEKTPAKTIVNKQLPPAQEPKSPIQQNEVIQSNKKEQLLSSLQKINMSEDQAKSILDAMKLNESQYIYQLRRQQYANDTKNTKQIEW
jgi:tetratricopeptide (TPR) repeat protein